MLLLGANQLCMSKDGYLLLDLDAGPASALDWGMLNSSLAKDAGWKESARLARLLAGVDDALAAALGALDAGLADDGGAAGAAEAQ
eukprot:SAG22_NODE_892_length_6646_cov_21.438369_1_plen_85_part_10